MKKLMTIVGLLLIASSAVNANEITVKNDIDHVTVFLNGAQVDRKGHVNIQRGTHELIFAGVSPHLRANTLQVKGKGDYTVLDVKHHVHHPEPVVRAQMPERIVRKIRHLEDSLSDIAFDLEGLNNRFSDLQLERTMIRTIRS